MDSWGRRMPASCHPWTYACASFSSSRIEPREGFLLSVLEAPDGAAVFLGVCDFIQAPDQAALAQRLDFEAMGFAIGAGDRLVGQVDRKPRCTLIEQLPHQRVHGRGQQAH